MVLTCTLTQPKNVEGKVLLIKSSHIVYITQSGGAKIPN